MPDRRRQLHLNTNILNSGKHDAGWRVQEDPFGFIRLDYYKRIAKKAEEGKLDAVFLADGVYVGPEVAARPWNSLEPSILLAALASVTERIGLIATTSTSFEDPYSVARRFASLEQISGGRSAWNIITTMDARAAANFGPGGYGDHENRYGRAEEFVEVVLKLWDSWEDGALVANQETGQFVDVSKLHPIEHYGERFSVAGALNVPRSPQGRPVVIQAGSSEEGKRLAARFAEAIFTVQNTFAEGKAFYAEMKSRAQRLGRDPNGLLILPGLLPIVGGTEQEAQARKDELDSFLDFDAELVRFAKRFELDAEQLSLDKPIPEHLFASTAEFNLGSRGFFEAMKNLAREQHTVRELILSNGSGHRQVVGAPEQIADTIEEWFFNGAADGFNLSADYFPSGLEDFVDHVVPILQQRGTFRKDYEGDTLRDHFGLERPISQFAARSYRRVAAAV